MGAAESAATGGAHALAESVGMSGSFDLAKTEIVEQLLSQPHDQRDGAWLQRFYDAVPDASMAAAEPQMQHGPDGFPYFWLHLPPVGEAFSTFSLNHIREVCTDNGWGCVLATRDGQPGWVFTYGSMWSLRLWGALDTVPAGAVRRMPEAGAQLLVAAPSEELMPSWARRVLRSWFEYNGLADVGVALVVDAAGYGGGEFGPADWLSFSVFPDQFDSVDAYQAFLERLQWFLPPRFAVLGAERAVFEYSPL